MGDGLLHGAFSEFFKEKRSSGKRTSANINVPLLLPAVATRQIQRGFRGGQVENPQGMIEKKKRKKKRVQREKY